MKNISIITIIALVLAAAIIALLWVFDALSQADAIDYGTKVGIAILIVTAAASIIFVLAGKNKSTGNRP